MSTLVITLNAVELELASRLADLRYGANADAKITSTNFGDKSRHEIDRIGVMGELAFAKQFNQYPYMTTEVRAGGADFKMGKMTIDVKATPYTNGDLLVHPRSINHPCDLYVLATVMTADVVLVGFATKAEVFAEASMDDRGYGPVYAVKRRFLHPFKPRLSQTAPVFS